MTTPVLAFPNNEDPFTLDTGYDNEDPFTTPVLAFPNNGGPIHFWTRVMTTTPVLAFPNNEDPFTLDTSYDNTSVGIPEQ